MLLIQYIDNEFKYLESYGYKMDDKCSRDKIVFVGKNRIVLLYDSFGSELTCYFEDLKSEKSILLQDVIEYFGINGIKGFYQLGRNHNIKKAIKCIAETIKKVLDVTDISCEEVFCKLYDGIEKIRENKLNEYYISLALKQADAYWSEKKYELALELYTQNSMYLSKLQRLRKKYIENNKLSV